MPKRYLVSSSSWSLRNECYKRDLLLLASHDLPSSLEFHMLSVLTHLTCRLDQLFFLVLTPCPVSFWENAKSNEAEINICSSLFAIKLLLNSVMACKLMVVVRHSHIRSGTHLLGTPFYHKDKATVWIV